MKEEYKQCFTEDKIVRDELPQSEIEIWKIERQRSNESSNTS